MKKIITIRENGSRRVQLDFSDEKTATQQHLKNECDVNVILSRYAKAGMPLPHVSVTNEISDFTKFPDFKTSLDVANDAMLAFSQLPAKIRQRFANNPQNLIDFVHDESNYDEALKLGLVVQRAAPQDQNQIQNQNLTPAAT